MAGARAGQRSVLVTFALFALMGLAVGVNGVLLLAQMADYGVGRSTIGSTFFTFSLGFLLGSVTAGPILHRWGARLALLGSGVALLACLGVLGARPAFLVFVLVQVGLGYGSGLLETVSNAHLAGRPNATTLLNRMHAFFGVGALVGPVAAEAMLHVVGWPVVMLAQGVLALPMFAAVWLTFPDRAGDPLVSRTHVSSSSRGLLATVLRQPMVLLGATMLSVYVGLEVSVGNWGFGYLVESRGASTTVASWTVSAYWGGLTLGRLLISPLAARIGLTKRGVGTVSVAGVLAAVALSLVTPVAGFVVLGFFLGPIFPTTIAVAPDLTEERLAPTAIGVMNGGSVFGGSALPWAAGALGQGVGVWTLLPFTLVLGVVQALVWWRLRLPAPAPAAVDQRT